MRKLVLRYLSPLIMTMAIVSLAGNGFNMTTVSAENTFTPPADPNPLLGECAGPYGGGYYSYLWADVITAEAFGAFTEAGGPYDKKVAERLHQNIFSVGNTIDPAEAYRNFRGRDPKVEALMKKRGFST